MSISNHKPSSRQRSTFNFDAKKCFVFKGNVNKLNFNCLCIFIRTHNLAWWSYVMLIKTALITSRNCCHFNEFSLIYIPIIRAHGIIFSLQIFFISVMKTEFRLKKSFDPLLCMTLWILRIQYDIKTALWKRLLWQRCKRPSSLWFWLMLMPMSVSYYHFS